MYLVGRTKPDPNFINTIKAPATQAKLVFQSITPGENVAPNFDTLFTTPYDAQHHVALIHSNSWGTRSFAAHAGTLHAGRVGQDRPGHVQQQPVADRVECRQ